MLWLARATTDPVSHSHVYDIPVTLFPIMLLAKQSPRMLLRLPYSFLSIHWYWKHSFYFSYQISSFKPILLNAPQPGCSDTPDLPGFSVPHNNQSEGLQTCPRSGAHTSPSDGKPSETGWNLSMNARYGLPAPRFQNDPPDTLLCFHFRILSASIYRSSSSASIKSSVMIT